MPTEFRWVTPKFDYENRDSSTEGLREKAVRKRRITSFCNDCERERDGTLGVDGNDDINWRCSECGRLQNQSWLDPY